MDFTLWDIVRNLLLAARWTLLLSIVAFAGGGIVGLAGAAGAHRQAEMAAATGRSSTSRRSRARRC